MLRIFFLFLLFCASFEGAPIPVPAKEYYDTTVPIANHPGHFPYISCLSFRKFSDHRIDQTAEWFDPLDVKLGDVVYVNVWLLSWFIKEVHDQIPHPYILISADVGDWVPDPMLKKLLYDPKVAAWFCRNIVFSHHPKIFQIPMGTDFSLFNFDTYQIEGLLDISARHVEKRHLLYMNYFMRKHGDRIRIAEMFENKPYCFTKIRSNEPFRETPLLQYFEEMASSKFILSPIGYELDCVRTWEALVLGSIPIVERTFLDPIYEELPVLIVDDWDEITQPFLEKKYEELKHRSRQKAFFPYWERQIREVQTKIREGTWQNAKLEATRFTDLEIKDLCTIFKNFDQILYKGFLSSYRPLQLAERFFLYLFDPWLDTASLQLFPDLNKNNIFIASLLPDRSQNGFYSLLAQFHAVFLDLTYFRNSLLMNFGFDFCHPRHLLKQHLRELYQNMSLFSLLCGTCADDEHVSLILSQISEEFNVEIKRLGNFWYLEKWI